MPWSPTIRAALLVGTPWPDGAPARRSICGPSIVTRWLLSAPWCSACGAPASAPMSKHRLGRDGTGSADRMKKKPQHQSWGLGGGALGGRGMLRRQMSNNRMPDRFRVTHSRQKSLNRFGAGGFFGLERS
jgi:hypothetical protein